MDNNFLAVAQTLAENFKSAELNSDLTNNIKQLIDKANQLLEQYDNTKPLYDMYNAAYPRVVKYEEFFKRHKEIDVSQETYDRLVDKATGFSNYRETKQREDYQAVYGLYETLNSISKDSYETIMKLRELFTRQQIIYAIEHVDKDIFYQEFLSEDDYLSLFNVDRGRIKNDANIKRISHFQVSLNTQHAVPLDGDNRPVKEKGIDIKNSRDWAYQMLLAYSEKTTGKSDGIKDNERWEMYTEAKSYFKNAPSEKDFNEYMDSFLMAKNAWLKKINSRGEIKSYKGSTSRMSALAFYQGGDSTFSETTLIQNKSTNANIRVGTIYNALRQICLIFKNFPSINEEQVLTLFTANFQNITKETVNSGFLIANEYAQKNIKEVVKYISSS